jgi:hypothetical protein
MRWKTRSNWGAVVAVLVFIGCEASSSNTPSASLSPSVAATIGDLREAATTLEGYGGLAKNKIRRNTEGEKLYAQAVAAHNGCISYIRAGLDTGMDPRMLHERLANADSARVTFITWCEKHGPREKPLRPRWRPSEYGSPAGGGAFVAAIAIDALASLIPQILELELRKMELEQLERDAQIRRIKEELGSCECKTWSEL